MITTSQVFTHSIVVEVTELSDVMSAMAGSVTYPDENPAHSGHDPRAVEDLEDVKVTSLHSILVRPTCICSTLMYPVA